MKISMMERRSDSTLVEHKIVIGILTVIMMNKQIVRHFRACESTITSLRTKIRQMGGVENRKTPPKDHVRPPGERTLTR